MIKGIPWWFKIAAKVVLSRLPFDYQRWARLGLFRHGAMTDPAYALRVFMHHYGRATFAGKGAGFTCLEMGPGDSLLSAPIAYAHGARSCHLIDAGNFASRTFDAYKPLLVLLDDSGLDVSGLTNLEDWAQVLAACNAHYGIKGLESLRAIPDRSVDFIWSQAVLEHIPKGQFVETMRELRRVLKPDGWSSHDVDLRDHFNGGLNNLRFSERVWEGELFSRSGFYTNRIRYHEMLSTFREAGFVVKELVPRRWKSLPISRAQLDGLFAELSEDDLLTSGFDVVLQ
jgi:SAM-dependent methyltransferase